MDPKVFLNKLNEYAELKPVRPARSGGVREADEPEEITRHGQSFLIDKDTNPSWAVQIKKLKALPRPCDYCDQMVINQKFNKRILHFPEMHWRESCSSCGLTKNPTTGKFDLTENRANSFYCSYFTNKNK